jgi:transposase
MGSESIEVVEPRRRWPVEVRLKILDEVLQPGASVAAVADRHGVARGLIYQWLRHLREGRMPGLSLNKPEAAAFVPVSIAPEAGPSPRTKPAPIPSLPSPAERASAAPSSTRRSGGVEIRLANARVKVTTASRPTRWHAGRHGDHARSPSTIARVGPSRGLSIC